MCFMKMLNIEFFLMKTCIFHYKVLYLRHLIYDFEVLTKSLEVGCILRQPLFLMWILFACRKIISLQ